MFNDSLPKLHYRGMIWNFASGLQTFSRIVYPIVDSWLFVFTLATIILMMNNKQHFVYFYIGCDFANGIGIDFGGKMNWRRVKAEIPIMAINPFVYINLFDSFCQMRRHYWQMGLKLFHLDGLLTCY